jgi:nitronate monooxygenase
MQTEGELYNMVNKKVQEIKQKLKLPVIIAPMFLVSNPRMVLEGCKSGVIGSFPALNARTEEILDQWMSEINQELAEFEKENPGEAGPWAINFVAHRSNKRYKEDLALIEKHQPPIVITSLGDPGPIAEIVHEYGGLVFSDVVNSKFAKKAIEKGSDGLILVASGAGGHGGDLNPIAFLHEVKTFWDGPVVLAGGMSKGEDVLASEIIGADFVYMGTRFIPSEESTAYDEYKEMIKNAKAEDILYTDVFTGVNANYLVPSIEKAGLDVDAIRNHEKMDLSEIKVWKDVWGAGQGVGAVHDIKPVADIVNELKSSYDQASEKIASRHKVMQN